MKKGKFNKILSVALVMFILPTFLIAAYAKEGSNIDLTLGSFDELLFVGQKLELVIEGVSIEDLKKESSIKWVLNETEIAGATSEAWTVAGKPGDKVSVDLIHKVNGTRTRHQIGVIVGVEITRSGTTLTANLLGFPVQPGNLTFQWLRNGTALSKATSSTYKIDPSDYGCKFVVKVTAKSASGYTGTISSNQFLVEPIKPGVPNISATAGNGSITVTFSAAANGSPITKYKLKITATGFSKEETVTTPASSYTFTGLTNDIAYTITVIATNAKGDSNPATATATPKAPQQEGGGGGPGPAYEEEEIVKEEIIKEAVNGEAQITADELKKASKLTVTAEVDEGQTLSIEFDAAALGVIGNEEPLIVKVEEVRSEGNIVLHTGSVKKAFDINAFVGETEINQFGAGTLTIVLPYVPEDGEDISKFAVYHIDDNGNATKLTATYDASKGGFVFTINHLSIFALVNETIWFDDVDMNGWSAEYIYYLANLNIVGGVGDNKFAPKRSITRAEFVKMLALTAGADVAGYVDSSFTDVDSSIWYAPYVEWAYRNGVTSGKEEGLFKPDDLITRQEIATMIFRYVVGAGLELTEAVEAVTFTDADTFAPYAAEAITALQKADIIAGMANPDGTFRFEPTAVTTREQAAKMLAVLHQILFS